MSDRSFVAKTDEAVFVMPVFLDGGSQAVQWLEEAVGSVLAQTDENWRLVMVNDQSPYPDTRVVLERLKSKNSRIHVIHPPVRGWAGQSRNIGIRWAFEQGHPYVLFLDSDDVTHPERVKTVRGIMKEDPAAGVVYSTIEVIDENGRAVPWHKLSGSIQEIIESHENPPQGKTAWIDIGTRTGYANLTSSTAVTTEVAFKQPFSGHRAAEDAHAWFRYGAEGTSFAYTPGIPTKYRIPQSANDSAMRDRIGGVDAYYAMQCDVERDGFEKALAIAIANKTIKASERRRLMSGYHVRMAESMRRIGQTGLANKEIERARAISPRFTGEWIEAHGYGWAQR